MYITSSCDRKAQRRTWSVTPLYFTTKSCGIYRWRTWSPSDSTVQPNVTISLTISRVNRSLPEDEDFVSSADALVDQMEEQNHLSRVLQDAGLVSAHNVLRLHVQKKQNRQTSEEKSGHTAFKFYGWLNKQSIKITISLSHFVSQLSIYLWQISDKKCRFKLHPSNLVFKHV